MTTRTIAGRRSFRALALCFAIAAWAGAGCGKKGPPLAPLVIVPAAPDQAAVRARGGSAAYQFRIPDANTSGTRPAEVARVEVYGYTGKPASDRDVVRLGTRVASVQVQPPPDPEAPPPPEPRIRPEGTFEQGDVVTVREPIGEAQRTPVVDRRKPAVQAALALAAAAVDGPLQPPAAEPPVRLYTAVGVSRKGRRGPFSERLSVPLVDPPPPPSAPLATHDEQKITLRWVAPAGFRRATIEPVAEGSDLLAAKPIGMPASSGGYNVYLVPGPAAAAAGREDAGGVTVAPGPLPAPLNAGLLAEPAFEDPALEFGQERCYAVRSVSVFGTLAIESDASPRGCLIPVDTFPPPVPGSLAAVGSEGAISLIWDASSAGDLQGYLVLRGEAGGELRPLTAEPIPETTYRDDQVKPGVRYTYAVVAVDAAGNRSAPSARVEETAREPGGGGRAWPATFVP